LGFVLGFLEEHVTVNKALLETVAHNSAVVANGIVDEEVW